MTPLRQPEESEFARIARVLRRRIWVIVACVAIATGVAVALSVLADEEYTASAALLFRDPGLDEKLFGAIAGESDQDPERNAETNLELTTLDTVADRTERRLPNDDGEVTESVEVSQRGESDVAVVEATAGDPDTAARLANTFAQEYIVFRREADRATVREAQELVEQQLAEVDPETTVSGRLQKLGARAEDLRVGVRGAHEHRVQLARQAHVVGVTSETLDEPGVFDPAHRLADPELLEDDGVRHHSAHAGAKIPAGPRARSIASTTSRPAPRRAR